jgi:hypothetical protein
MKADANHARFSTLKVAMLGTSASSAIGVHPTKGDAGKDSAVAFVQSFSLI